MITKTAREIIKNARYIAGVRNSNITDFYTNCLLLNNIYSQLYVDVVKNNDAYIEYEDVVNGDVLPDDCYLLMAVYKRLPNDNLIEVEPMPKNQRLIGSYYRIENNAIYFGDNSQYRIKYTTMPDTLTAPDKIQKLDIDNNSVFGKMTEEGFYYQSNDKNYFYNLTTEQSSEVDEFVANETKYEFNGHTIEFKGNTVIVDDEVWLENVTNYVFSYPYSIVTFSDGHVYIYTGLSDGVIWNYYCTQGKDTVGKVVSAYTNEETGKGMIFISNNGSVYYSSFVPDTVLSYPDNTFFTLMEYELADILCSLNGQDNSFIENKLIEDAKTTFYATVRKDSYRPYRMENVRR